MSMNNLEVKVSELTSAVRNLSNKPMLSSTDINNLLDNLTTRFENVNTDGIENVQVMVLEALEKQQKDVEEKLSSFENIVSSIEKLIQNPKIDSEISRILNDIEALYSKMNSQELIYDELKKNIESLKSLSNTGRITKISDDIVAISKSYDGIVDVLNKNFEEFLRRVEALTSREEIQRLRYYLETIEGNQNVLVTAMNVVNDKQDEIKNILRQSSASSNIERFELIQTLINNLREQLLESSSKRDLELVEDKVDSIMSILGEVKRNLDDNNDKQSANSAIENQLKQLVSKIDELKINSSSSSLNEDIIRLYTSIAEFKDGISSMVNNKLNEVSSNLDVSFDKISGSLVNSNIETNESVTNMIGEVQKMNSILHDDLNAKAFEIKQDVQKSNQASTITLIEAIKTQKQEIIDNLQGQRANDGLKDLIIAVDNIRTSFDTDGIAIQLSKIKDLVANFEPIKESLVLTAKTEEVEVLVQRLEYLKDIVTENSNSEATKVVLEKLENLAHIIDRISNANVIEQLEAIENGILSQSLDNFKNIQGILLNFQTDVENRFENIREGISSFETSDYTSILSSSLDELEKMLYDKLTTIEEVIENSKNKAKEEIIEDIKNSFYSMKEELKDASKAFLSEIESHRAEILADFIKTQLSEVKIEISNYLKQETDIITSLISENDASNKEILMKLAQYVDIKEKTDDKAELLKRISENLLETLNNTNLIRSGLDEEGNILNIIKDKIEDSNVNFEDWAKKNKEEIIGEIQRASLQSNDTSASFDKIFESAAKNKEEIIEEIQKVFLQSDDTSVSFDKLFEKSSDMKTELEKLIDTADRIQERITVNSDEINKILEDKMSVIASNIELIQAKANENASQNDFEIKEALNTIAQSVEEHSQIKETLKIIAQNIEEHSQNKEVLNAIAQNAEEHSQIKEALKDIAQGAKEHSDIKETLNTIAQNVGEYSQIKETLDIIAQDAKEHSDIKEAINAIAQNVEEHSQIKETLDTLAQNIEEHSQNKEVLNAIAQNVGEYSQIKETLKDIAQDVKENSSIKEAINVIAQNVEEHYNKLKDFTEVQDASILENIASISEKNMEAFNNLNDSNRNLEEVTTDISSKYDAVIENMTSLSSTVENMTAKLMDGAADIATNDFVSNAVLELKKEFFETRNGITVELKEEIQKVLEKALNVENLVETESEKSSGKILESLSVTTEANKQALEDKTDFLANKFDDVIKEIYAKVDEKVYEIISRNNDVIKDELKLSSLDTQKSISKDLEEKLAKIEAYFTKSSDDEENQDHVYTMGDMEADIAKIKLGLEKNNKLSNFKEFATRLVELKNINLENAKISRAIGSDVMRFDNWLKNATAKIDHLAAKIEKSEKIRLEDIKSRIIQGEKNQSLPQKLEDNLINIYKKYRAQEVKLSEVMSKIDSISAKQNETFNAKEFIDIFYDNTQKTQNMVARMDELEDKLDLIQAKIDHIITSCIDE